MIGMKPTRIPSLFCRSVLLLCLSIVFPSWAASDSSFDRGMELLGQKDYLAAEKFLREAALAGNGDAMVNLGVMYEQGLGVGQSYPDAVIWYRKAADAANASGMFYLGVMYNIGRGVLQDRIEALRWFRRAADFGQATAMATLGWSYRSGSLGVQNYADARYWFGRAAEAGNVEAERELGVMYEYGGGGARDVAKAYTLYRQAFDKTAEPYTLLRLWLAGASLDHRTEVDAELRLFRQQKNPEAWVADLLAFFANDMTESELLHRAEVQSDADRVGRLCEAYYYAGRVRLLKGNTDVARDFFRRAVALGQSDFSEHYSAQAELLRLESE